MAEGLSEQGVSKSLRADLSNQDGPYTDDVLASKKLAVNFVYKTAGKPKTSPWVTNNRGLVTDESIYITIQFVEANFEKKPLQIRKKITRPDFEEKLEL